MNKLENNFFIPVSFLSIPLISRMDINSNKYEKPNSLEIRIIFSRIHERKTR